MKKYQSKTGYIKMPDQSIVKAECAYCPDGVALSDSTEEEYKAYRAKLEEMMKQYSAKSV